MCSKKSILPQDELEAVVGLGAIQALTPHRWHQLRRHFGPAQKIWTASAQQLREAGLSVEVAGKIVRERDQLNPRQVCLALKQHNIRPVPIDDPVYPPLLKHIHLPPALLYVRGQLDWQRPCVAVVGTRRPTRYGRQVTHDLCGGLARSGVTIVSGLAFGIDGVAAEAALEAGGPTVAVLGCGLDSIYPQAHTQLAQRVAKQGLVLSEFRPGTQAMPHHFPQRNRIIAGLSLATIVVEAAAKSGALITARYALEQNRDVMAVPGNIYEPVSQGTHALIKQGAQVVTGVQDILDALGIDPAQKSVKPLIFATKAEQQLWEMLSAQPIHVDKLVVLSRLTVSTVHAILMQLELKGAVKHLGGQQYIKKM
jgi:DNA processing protein